MLYYKPRYDYTRLNRRRRALLPTAGGGGATEVTATYGVSVGSTMSASIVTGAASSFSVSLDKSMSGQAERECNVDSGAVFNHAPVADATTDGYITFSVQGGQVVVGDAVAEADTSQDITLGYAVTGQVSGGAAVEEVTVSFGLNASAIKTAEATAYASMATSTSMGGAADRSAEAASNLSVGLTAGSQAQADAVAESSLAMTSEIAATIIAEAAAEAGITSGHIYGVTFTATSVSGSIVTTDGHKYRVKARARTFRVKVPPDFIVH